MVLLLCAPLRGGRRPDPAAGRRHVQHGEGLQREEQGRLTFGQELRVFFFNAQFIRNRDDLFSQKSLLPVIRTRNESWVNTVFSWPSRRPRGTFPVFCNNLATTMNLQFCANVILNNHQLRTTC